MIALYVEVAYPGQVIVKTIIPIRGKGACEESCSHKIHERRKKRALRKFSRMVRKVRMQYVVSAKVTP